MANGSGTETTEGGINWGSLIPGVVDLIKTGVGAAAASTTQCGKMCRQKCRQETGWLFGGRQECKRKCKSDCIAQSNEKSEKPNPYPMIIASIIIVLSILGILWWIFRKK